MERRAERAESIGRTWPCAADVACAGLVGRHAAIGENKAGHAPGSAGSPWREVVGEVLHPGEVGVALVGGKPELGLKADGGGRRVFAFGRHGGCGRDRSGVERPVESICETDTHAFQSNEFG